MQVVENSIIIFFYIDNIIVVYNKHKSKKADNAVKLLQQKYTITEEIDL